MTDPLGAAALREAALTAWRASPARLREDANSEEDHARGGYRDRVVVELAQNAADAAGTDGRLLLRLVPGPRPLLLAANTGTPLDSRGLASLATLRASAKSGAGPTSARVGRFGVGFAAVRSVSDEIAVLTDGGSAHFSLGGAAALLAAEPALDGVVASRRGALPALRLPFAGPGSVGEAALTGPDAPMLGDPWDTVVVLELRDDAAVSQVAAQLEAVDDGLLLALPGLVRVTIEQPGSVREIAGVRDRWIVATATGEFSPAALADRPTEEQERRGWQLSWAVRRDGVTVSGPVHAPTPTDEPCTVPAMLVGTFPLDPSRRHVVPGAATDLLVQRSGEVWARLLLDCRDERAAGRAAPDPLDLLPRAWPAGALDGAVRDALLAATRSTPVLSTAGDGRGIAPRDAAVLAAPWTSDRAALDVLGAWDASLVRLDDTHRDLVRLLGLRVVAMAEIAEQLPAAEPAWLRRVYDLFSGATGDSLADLAAVPVPLRDGRVVHGARGLVIVDGDVPAPVLDALAGAGLRIVDPEAAHPVLERLGAERADASALARHPLLRGWVLGEEGEDERAATEVLLGLLGAAREAGRRPDPEPWWGEALLEAEDGDAVPARGLTLPGTDAAEWFDEEVLPRVAPWLVDRWGELLTEVGVLRGPATVRADDPVVTEALDGWAEYLDELGAPREGEELLAVADLDALRPEAWGAVLLALADGSWSEVLRPVLREDGGRSPSYTAWWLRTRAPLGLGAPFALPGVHAQGAARLLGPPPRAVSAVAELLAAQGAGPAPVAAPGALELLRALGGVWSTAELDAEGWVELCEGLEVGATCEHAVAVDLWRSLARVAAGKDPVDEISRLPALVADGPSRQARVVAAEEAAVVDPMWAQLDACLPAIVVPAGEVERAARALDLDTGADRARGRVTSSGTRVPTPPVLLDLIPGLPPTWLEHEELRVDGEPVDWWVSEGQVHASTTDGLACGTALLAGWAQRDRIARLLHDPSALTAVLLDRAGDPLGA
ncbi:sacsin N-terminal ATP-binding-like domain-containing protein [Actinotalea sp.]|uniref:sacsin N-terminal ATP-binding-like domain-containing protein n=1 Tax=Actinotalea sp. TaxID=1872145 RepID=UPI00356202EC